MIRRTWTAEEFAEARYELPEGGRWAELIAGEPISLLPPSDNHGPTVLNISKALAEYQEQRREGYACFELGLIVERDPDTVLCPSISYFVTGNRWEELDKVVTEVRPALVVEMASTSDRRRNIAQRVFQYLAWGVAVVWVVDPKAKTVAVHQAVASQFLSENSAIATGTGWSNDTFRTPILRSFSLELADVFRDRKW